MANYLSTIILAIIQGITEWLPISSSGHLVIGRKLLGLQTNILLDTALHVATLLAVTYVYRKELKRMIIALLRWEKDNKDFKMIWWLILATIPIAITGLLFKEHIETAFNSLLIVGITLLATGTILYLTRYAKPQKKLTLKNAFIIGTAQILALLPGISRSGTTISTGLYLGVAREEAAKFSFLLFIPAVLGAGVLQATTADWSKAVAGELIIGMLVAMTVSIISLKWLIKIIKKGKLHRFSWYCWGIGILTILSVLL